MLRLLLVLLFFNLGLFADLDVVMFQIPLLEGGGVDSDNAILDQSFGSNQLIVRRIVDDVHDFSLLGDTFRSPVEVALVKSQGSEFHVAAPHSKGTDSSLAQLGVSRHTTQLELSLLLMNRHATTGGSSFMA